ncbi:MAG TPA: serine/threonine-protein kinase [Polyangium sp.]|nr:serine/threonine-protein kinase [Polyangium sp.]
MEGRQRPEPFAEGLDVRDGAMPYQGQFITSTIRLLRRLEHGVGGMGEVWAAEHLALRTHVAVKFMVSKHARSDASQRRFTQEAQAAALLQSPHVAKVFDHATTVEGEPYIVMELLRGETLRSRLDRSGALPIEDVCRMIEHTAKALSEAHRMGLVHRDIKPDNLFVLDVEGESFLKVLDFGIVKQIDGEVTTSSGSSQLGVVKYMSPERLGVQTRAIDHRADLWALAIVAYELLTGAVPFAGKTDFLVAKAIEVGKFTPPTHRRSDIPVLVDAWMEKALAPYIDDRFDAAMDMADKLHIAIHRRPRLSSINIDAKIFVETAPFIDSEPLPASQKFVHEPRRSSGIVKGKETDKPSRPSQLRGAGSERAGESGFVEGRRTLRFDPRFPRVPGDLQADNYEENVWCAMAADEWPRSVTFDVDGPHLFMASWNGDVSGIDVHFHKRLWTTKLVVRVNCIVSGPNFVALGCSDGRLRLLDSATGKLVQLMAGHRAPVRDLALNQDGSTLVSCSEDNSVCSWRVSTGELAAMLPDELKWVRAVAMVGDGSLIATGGDDASVRLWDAQLRAVTTVGDGSSPGLVRTVVFSRDGRHLAAGFGDGAVRVWETRKWELLRTLRGDGKQIHSLTFDGAGTHIIAGLVSGGIRVWEILSGVLERDVMGRGRPMISLDIDSSGHHLASACNEGRVNVYRWPLDSRLREVPGDKRAARG